MGPKLKVDLEKLAKAFEVGLKVKDVKDGVSAVSNLVDNNVVSGILTLLSFTIKRAKYASIVGIVADLLEAESLNSSEDQELEKLRSKYEFEKFLKKKGIDPDAFYREIFRNDTFNRQIHLANINAMLTKNSVKGPTMRARP